MAAFFRQEGQSFWFELKTPIQRTIRLCNGVVQNGMTGLEAEWLRGIRCTEFLERSPSPRPSPPGEGERFHTAEEFGIVVSITAFFKFIQSAENKPM